MKHITLALIVFCSFTLTQSSWALSGAPLPERHAQAISGEIAGKHTFIASVAGEWTFKLEPSSHGWDIRLRDQDGMDLTRITPPFHSVPNARELYHWHFRNADYTGKKKSAMTILFWAAPKGPNWLFTGTAKNSPTNYFGSLSSLKRSSILRAPVPTD